MKPHRCKRTKRAGYALVLFVMMFFGLMGLAALVIDMGFARLAQRQMQTAVDSAALEGLRWRNVQQSGDLPQAWFANPDFQNQTGVVQSTGTLTSQQSDAVRRWAASNVVANVFADYPDSSGATVHYGAGPILDFTGGVGPTDLAASQLMQPGTPPVYQPGGLSLNTGNAPEGDMSPGTYNGGQPSTEADDYTRADFTYAPPGSAPSASNAFLVRMRRTGSASNTSGLDQEPGVSSSGPTLPVLFGRGSMMARSGNTGQLSVASGITVRATAIAAAGTVTGLSQPDVGRAKAAGPPYQYTDPNTGSQIGIPGVTPFALSSTNDQNVLTVDGSGAFAGGGQAIQPAVLEIGQTVGASIKPISAGTLTQYYIASQAVPTSQYYVPVLDPTNTIIGFRCLQSWAWQGDASGGTLTVTPSAQSQPIGYGNVTSVLPPGLIMDTTAVSALFASHGTFTNPLYAPVLVNHHIGPQQSSP
jgi:hypothetical protein